VDLTCLLAPTSWPLREQEDSLLAGEEINFPTSELFFLRSDLPVLTSGPDIRLQHRKVFELIRTADPEPDAVLPKVQWTQTNRV